MRNHTSVIGRLLLVLLGFWFLFSVMRVGYNAGKFLLEDWQVLLKTDQYKKEVTYGDYGTLAAVISKESPKDQQIYLYTSDGKAFFLTRYFVYPKKVIWLKNAYQLQEVIKTGNKKGSIVVYPSTEEKTIGKLLKLYKHKDILSSKQQRIGVIYK